MTVPIETVVAIVRDLVTSLAALTAAVVAVIGLYTWRRQLRGGVELDTARAALRSAYKMRDAIRTVRNPFHDINEIMAAARASSEDEETSEGPNAVLRKYERPLYAKRWQEVLEAGSDLRLAEVEGEVLWGQPFVESLKPLTKCVADLSFELSEYLRYKEMNNRSEAEEAVMKASAATVKAAVGKKAPDEFERQVDQAIEQLEDFVRPMIELKLRSA